MWSHSCSGDTVMLRAGLFLPSAGPELQGTEQGSNALGLCTMSGRRLSRQMLTEEVSEQVA
jgi:hypothetical protein